jgi:uncharacterized protein involved in exopolysaccharide biosynthesis
MDGRYLLGKLRANAIVVLALPVTLCAAALLYTFLARPVYEAQATLYFPRGSSPTAGVATVSTESESGLSSLAGGPTPIKIFARFLESETCLEYVSKESGLSSREIHDVRKFEEDPSASMLTVSIDLPVRQQAKRVLEDHLRALANINQRISSTYLTDETSAIEHELATEREKLSEAQAELVGFQRRANSAPSASASEWQSRLLQAQVDLVSTRSSIRAASAMYSKSLSSQGLSPSDIPPVVKLRPRLVDAQYQLDILLKSLGPDAPEVRHLGEQIDNIKAELRSEVAAYVSSINKGLIDPTGPASSGAAQMNGLLEHEVSLESQIEALNRLAKVAPGEQGTLAHLTLQVSIQSELVKQTTLQLESARLQALRDPNKWSLLDAPWINPKPVNKKYVQVSMIALAFGLMMSLVWTFNFGRPPNPR